MSFMEIIGSSRSDLEDKSLIVLNDLPVMILISDLDGKIVYSNQYIETVLGFSFQDLQDLPVWFLYKEQDKGERLFNKWKQKANVGETVSFNLNIQLSNKTKKWLDVKVRKPNKSQSEGLVLWTASDITRLKIMERDLARNKARVEAFLESAAEGILTTNKNGNILNLNPAVEQIFGYRESEMVGEEISSFITLPTSEFAEADLVGKRRMLMGQKRQVQAIHKDGHIFPVELSLSKITAGNDIFYTGLIRDISESRKLEAEILKIAEKERFKIGQDLHDGVGQMLSAIAMISGNLARKARANGLSLATELDEITDMIHEADQEVRQLSHGLAHVELENEGLQFALKRMCERFQSLSDTRCRFICSPGLEIKDNITTLHLFRIVQEAIQNAIKHGKPKEIKVQIKKDENYIVLLVENDGDGLMNDIEIEMQKGMGLNTMRYRAEILGGNFSIDNTSDGRTRVRCIIPIPSE
jgi:PAS domain S-box-containing protein